MLVRLQNNIDLNILINVNSDLIEKQFKHPLGARLDCELIPASPNCNSFEISDKNMKGTTTEQILYNCGQTNFTLQSAVNILSQVKKFNGDQIQAIARHFILSQNNPRCQNVLTFDEFKVFLGRIVEEGLDMFQEQEKQESKDKKEIEASLLLNMEYFKALKECKQNEIYVYLL